MFPDFLEIVCKADLRDEEKCLITSELANGQLEIVRILKILIEYTGHFVADMTKANFLKKSYLSVSHIKREVIKKNPSLSNSEIFKHFGSKDMSKSIWCETLNQIAKQSLDLL